MTSGIAGGVCSIGEGAYLTKKTSIIVVTSVNYLYICNIVVQIFSH